MHVMRFIVCSIGSLAVTLLPAAAAAQTLGSFTWQQQPYCNRLTFIGHGGRGRFHAGRLR